MMVARKRIGRSPFLTQWVWLGAALTVLLTLIAANLYRTHGRIAEREEERLSAQVGIVADNMQYQLLTVSSILDRILTDMQESRTTLLSGDVVGSYFSALAAALPGVRSIAIVDAHGNTIASDRSQTIGRNVGGHPYYREIKAHPDAHALYVSLPYQSSLYSNVVNVSRMIPGRDGEFAGTVSVMLNPPYFSALLTSVLYAPDMWGGIYHADGPAFVTEPMKLSAASVSHAGHMIVQRSVNPATLKIDKPLMIELGRDETEIFLQWSQDIAFRTMIFLSICLASSLAVRAFQFAQRRSEHQAAGAEAVLQATRENYQLIVENTTDLVAKLDPQGNYTYLNQAFSSIYGKAAGEHLGEHFSARVVEADRELAHMSFRKLFDPPYALSFTLRELTMGGIRHLQWTARALFDVRGNTTEIIAIGRDMTDHMRQVGILEHQAYQDFLTGLANRRYFMELAREELTRASCNAEAACLLMVDVDHFKHINDAHGHRVGDLMLQSFSKVLLKTLRSGDIIARVGGEEFAVLMPETTLDLAVEIAGRLKSAIAENALCVENTPVLRVTASIGVAAWCSGLDLDDLMEMADGALYQAKHSGRNRICVAGRSAGIERQGAHFTVPNTGSAVETFI